ncbi:universal stress protein [Verrucomicrobiota bacterium sgz303538]
MSILCATDFSPAATNATRVALALAQRLGDTMLFTHIVEPRDTREPPSDLIDELSSHFRKHLDQKANQLRDRGVEVHTELLSGHTVTAIADLAEREKPRMVVVAATGRSAPESWLLGSTAEGLAELVPSPTLVVRDPAPLEAWARGERQLKVMVASDFTLSSEAALCWARSLQEIGPCEITVAHVVWSFNEGDLTEATDASPRADISSREKEIVLRDLSEWIQSVVGDLASQIRCVASMGRPDFRLVELAQKEGVDLVVTGTHQHHGLERLREPSFSRGLLRHAPMSVACVPSTAVVTREERLPEIRRVLVATDFSDPASRAICFGCSVVEPEGKLRIVSVVRHEQDIEKIEKELQNHIPDSAAQLGIEVELTVIVSPDIACAICEEAERFGANLVCVGTQGADRIPRKLLGSVARAVAARCRRPVLLVPRLAL